MSCHESLVREFLENWVMFGQNTNKEEHKVFIRACKPGCRGTDHRWRDVQCRPTGCDARGRSRDWGGEGCNCRDKYYDPCQHPFIVGDYHIYSYHAFDKSTRHFLQLQSIECMVDGVNNDARCSDVDKELSVSIVVWRQCVDMHATPAGFINC